MRHHPPQVGLTILESKDKDSGGDGVIIEIAKMNCQNQYTLRVAMHIKKQDKLRLLQRTRTRTRMLNTDISLRGRAKEDRDETHKTEEGTG